MAVLVHERTLPIFQSTWSRRMRCTAPFPFYVATSHQIPPRTVQPFFNVWGVVVAGARRFFAWHSSRLSASVWERAGVADADVNVIRLSAPVCRGTGSLWPDCRPHLLGLARRILRRVRYSVESSGHKKKPRLYLGNVRCTELTSLSGNRGHLSLSGRMVGRRFSRGEMASGLPPRQKGVMGRGMPAVLDC